MRNFLRPFVLGLLTLGLAVLPASAQRLVSVTPGNGASGVSPSTSVTFTFNVDMEPIQEITWFTQTGGLPGSLSGIGYEWTTPRTLVASRNGGFPASTMIIWSLDEAGFSDEDGFPLESSDMNAGFFMTGSGGGGGTSGGSAEMAVFKVAHYDQISPADPVLSTNGTYLFGADASAPDSRGLTNVVLTAPGGAKTNLFTFLFSPGEFFLVHPTNSLTELETRFPSGNYVFSLQAEGSNQNVTVNLPSTAFPAAPKISNFAAGQSIDATADFTLNFNAGGSASEFVEISIWDQASSDEVYYSPDIFEEGRLTGADTGVLLPAGTFQEGRTYEIEIGRWIAGTNSVGGNAVASGIGTVTRSVLRTAGGEPVTIQLEEPNFNGGLFQARATLEPNRLYHFERSTNAVNWVSISEVFAVESAQVFFDFAATNAHAIYRLRRD